MKNSLSKLIFSCLLFLLFTTNNCYAQSSSLQIFEQFMDKNWTGHYMNSEDSGLVHSISWEYILNEKGVKETKSVPEVGFKMETYYYFDWEKNQVSFISLINKDMNSKGKVIIEGSRIILEGENFFDGGSNTFRKIFEIQENGKIVDSFFRRKGDAWIMGHRIEYE